MSEYPRIELVWTDPQSPFYAWTAREEALEKLNGGVAECTTVGYLIVDNPEYVGVASSLSPDEMGDGLIVPRVNVREIRYLDDRPAPHPLRAVA